MSDNHGEGPIQQETAIHLSQRLRESALFSRETVYVLPEGRCQYIGYHIYGKSMLPHQKVESVCHYFGVSLHGALVAELLQIPPVYTVG
jgi:hypothetical protein